jgi:hypothetical protein
MANEKPEVKQDGLSSEMMFKMLLDTQKQLSTALTQLAEAQRESRIPYVDPAVAVQKKQALEDRMKQVRLELKQREVTKTSCRHLRVDEEGNFIEGKPNIKWHQHSNNIVTGVCGTCFSTFDTRNPADLSLLRKDAAGIRSMAKSRESYIPGF